MSLFLSSKSVKDNRKILLCRKSGENSETIQIQDKNTQVFGSGDMETIRMSANVRRGVTKYKDNLQARRGRGRNER
jgi:hypothetical protein